MSEQKTKDHKKKKKAVRQANSNGKTDGEAIAEVEEKIDMAEALKNALAKIDKLEKKINEMSETQAQFELKIETNRTGIARVTETGDRNTTFIRMHSHRQQVPRPGPGEEPEK